MQLIVRAKMPAQKLGLMKRAFVLITAAFLLSALRGHSQTIVFPGKKFN